MALSSRTNAAKDAVVSGFAANQPATKGLKEEKQVPHALKKRVLFILSEWGFWEEELIGPLETLDARGYTIDFATPTGKRPVALTPSIDPGYKDPPLGAQRDHAASCR